MHDRRTDNQDFTQNFTVTGEEHNRYFGLYRARVINNHEDKEGNTPPEKEGRIEVWVPSLMMDIEQDKTIYAHPVFPFASQNTNKADEPSETAQDESKRKDGEPVCDDYGSYLVPPKNSYVFVFFEDGDPNQCRYLPLGPSFIQKTTIQEVKNKCAPEKEFYLLKTPHGHRTFISDNDERLVDRSYLNFFMEICEHKDKKLIEIFAPSEKPTNPFGSDKGPIGEGNEATEDKDGNERKNEDNHEKEENTDDALYGGKGGEHGSWKNKGGQKSTIVVKGGNGINGSERTKQEQGGGEGGSGEESPACSISGTDEENQKCKEREQKGEPVKGYRGEWNSHDKKQFLQFETPDQFFLYLNQHEDDRFLKAQTQAKYRFEMNEHEKKKYIQLEHPDGWQLYINAHEDDQFFKVLTPDQYRFEINQHKDKRFVQIQTPEKYAFYMNCHEDDQFIRLLTPAGNILELNEKEEFAMLVTAKGHRVKLDDKNGKITIASSGDEQFLEFDVNTGKATLKSKTVVIESADIHLGGDGGSPVLTTAGPSSTTSAV